MGQSRHVANIYDQKPSIEVNGSSVSSVTAEEFPLLKGMSLRRLLLAPGTIREPHWHVNGHELNYCLRGTALVTMFANGNDYHRFTITEGQMYFVPSGALHSVENIGGSECEVIGAVTNERPEDFGLSGSLGVMSDNVIGNTFDLPGEALAARSHSSTSTVIDSVERVDTPIRDDGRVDAYKFDIEAQEAPVDTTAGIAKLARKQYWNALEDISMYSLRIPDSGMREPHWHPGTAEMGFVAAGAARMTILDPDGSFDTYELKAGDLYFVPKAYPHHIEDMGNDEFHFLIFFDRETPGDIGIRAAMGAFSPEVVAAAFGLPAEQVPPLPFTPADGLVVSRSNPRDPVV